MSNCRFCFRALLPTKKIASSKDNKDRRPEWGHLYHASNGLQWRNVFLCDESTIFFGRDHWQYARRFSCERYSEQYVEEQKIHLLVL